MSGLAALQDRAGSFAACPCLTGLGNLRFLRYGVNFLVVQPVMQIPDDEDEEDSQVGNEDPVQADERDTMG